ncbi:hypothetical protein ABPG75_001167, partial [Micractinium tetrahymenae]
MAAGTTIKTATELGGADPIANRAALESLSRPASTVANLLNSNPATAAEMDAALATAGFDFELTASQVQQACLLVLHELLEKLSPAVQLPGRASSEQLAAYDGTRIAPVARRLVAADASRAIYHLWLSFVMPGDMAGAAAALRTAVRLGVEHR